MKKLDLKQAMYLIVIGFSLYFSYLIYNAYSMPINTSLILSLGILSGAIGVLYIFNRNIETKNIKKNVLKIISIITIIISIGIIMCNFDFFTKKFTNSEVKIIVQNEKNEHSLSNMVSIRKIILNNMLLDLKTININNDWNYENNTITNNNKVPSELEISLVKGNEIIITFDKTENSGIIKIIDGEYEETLDLYSYKYDTYQYRVKSNAQIDILFGIRLICSYILIYLIVELMLIASYYMYKTKKSLILPTMILVFMLRCLYYSKLQAYVIFYDSTSYIEYSFSELLNLQIPARTPVYPLIIRICQTIADNIMGVVVLQIVVSFIAVIYFYKTLRLIIDNEKIIALVTIFYGGTMAICGWDNCILTESFALSGYVFFVYNIIKYIKDTNIINGFSAVIISLILTFLRPTSIILLVMLFAFWIIRFLIDRKQIKTDVKCFIGSVISVVIVVIYSIIFYNTHQIYSISDPTIRQDLFICINEGFYKASNNQQFIDDIEQIKHRIENTTNLVGFDKIWEIEREIQAKYGNKQVQELTSYCRSQMFPEYTQYIIKLMRDNSAIYYEGYSGVIHDNIHLIPILEKTFRTVNFAYVYIMIIAELCTGIYLWIKSKNIPWIHMGVFAFSFAIMFSTFIGTNSEYMRTSIGVLPFFYISVAMLVQYIYGKEVK